MKCGATTMLSSRVSDRPPKLSQILKMGELRWKLAVLARGRRGPWLGDIPSSALPALAIDCDPRPKSVVLEHNSNADSARPRHPRIVLSRIIHVVSVTASCPRCLVRKRRDLSWITNVSSDVCCLSGFRLRETFAVDQDSGAAGRWPSAVTPTLAVAARGGCRQGNPSGERRFGVGFRAEDESTPRDAQGSYTYEVRF